MSVDIPISFISSNTVRISEQIRFPILHKLNYYLSLFVKKIRQKCRLLISAPIFKVISKGHAMLGPQCYRMLKFRLQITKIKIGKFNKQCWTKAILYLLLKEAELDVNLKKNDLYFKHFDNIVVLEEFFSDLNPRRFFPTKSIYFCSLSRIFFQRTGSTLLCGPSLARHFKFAFAASLYLWTCGCLYYCWQTLIDRVYLIVNRHSWL